MDKVLNMTYASSLTDLCALNSSFDTGVLRVAYTGENNNRSSISKEAFERSIPTMFNCPIVCNYDRESDTLGGHDIEIVRTNDGSMRVINATTPVGCIPESAKYWWDVVTESNGVQHEYLNVEVLIWKRQEAYQKIKRDGITAHSMEITVRSGEMIDEVFHIYDFEFTAFALIGVTPCFESSSLEMFSKHDFKEQLSEMMRDLKESFSLTAPSNDGGNTQQNNKPMEGGEKTLEDKMKIVEQYGIDIDTLDFSLDDYTEEELVEKFEAMKEQNDQNTFALTGALVDEIIRVLANEKVHNEWGEYCRYLYVDSDFEAGEVYCWDANDWLLYGFKYTLDGDSVMIDYESKTRKKYAIVDFDEGEQASPFATMFAQMEAAINEKTASEQSAFEKISDMESELTELREFKNDVETATAQNERADVLSRFGDLADNEEFQNLCENSAEYTVDELEEKCYALRGRYMMPAKFSATENPPKLKVIRTSVKKPSEDPYNGLFEEYGNN